ncbi:MAG TPA: hypothetical protein PK833_02670, partial [Vicingus sp.]|nr:hypothetical protein [Vicingus sp.]
PGNHVVAHFPGAYNVTQSMQFISLRPAIVMIDTKGKPHLIKTKESLEGIQKDELVPEHLRIFKL